MAKEFKTIDQLIQLMKSRGLLVDEGSDVVLRRESYYAIVNGYKSPFLDRIAMQCSADDVYKHGMSFQHIVDLFNFDRELRGVTFSMLTKAESALKNAVVYAFCERYPECNSYLERSNYTEPKEMLVPKAYRGNKVDEYSTNMATLMRILNGKIDNKRKARPFVRHYLDCYGQVPLWVLQNDLTFGNIAHFYQLQKRSVQNSACKIIGQISNRGIRVTPHDMLRMFDVLVGYRNICAHDERLYCASVKGARFSDMFAELCLVLPKSETSLFLASLNNLIQSYGDRIDKAVLTHVYLAMGIDVG